MMENLQNLCPRECFPAHIIHFLFYYFRDLSLYLILDCSSIVALKGKRQTRFSVVAVGTLLSVHCGTLSGFMKISLLWHRRAGLGTVAAQPFQKVGYLAITTVSWYYFPLPTTEYCSKTFWELNGWYKLYVSGIGKSYPWEGHGLR